MKLIETSLQIALRAYAGKTDKAGREYILHPLRVMLISSILDKAF